jgi:DNA-directed RNA polymerase subunit RPC12/RpoP
VDHTQFPGNGSAVFLYLPDVFPQRGKPERENFAFLRLKGKFTDFFGYIKMRLNQRKTHRFYKCPSCKQRLRVPKGKGRISIRCSKCGTSFEKKT